MSKPSFGALSVVVSILFTVGVAAQAAPPSETLLPVSTTGYVSIPSVKNLLDTWRQTQLGRLLDDPMMKPFADDLRRQLKEKWSQSHARLGLSIEDLEKLAGGELALAVVRPEGDDRAAVAVLADVAGKEQQAEAILAKLAANLEKQGAKRSSATHHGIKFTIYQSPPRRGQDQPLHAAYFIHEGLFVASDQVPLASDIAGRLVQPKKETLASVPAYQAVMDRCQKGQPRLEPQVRWFIDPIGLAESFRSWQEHRRKGATDYVKIAKKQGFEAVRGAGGLANLSGGKYDLLHRTYVYAPPPYELAMRMMAFPNGGEFTPQPWVPRNLSSYMSFQCDIVNAFDHVDTLFDEIYGDTGVWQDTMDSIENDTQINLRRDLIVHLGQRVSVITDYETPITPTSQRRLLAIEAKNSKALAEAIERSMRDDERAKKRKIGDSIVWEILPEEMDTPELNIQDFEAATEPSDDDTGDGQQVDLTRSAVTVAHGYLLVSSHVALLEQVLQSIGPGDQLGGDGDFQRVLAEFEQLGAKETSAQGFARSDQQYRVTYELFREGKMPEADTFLGHFLNFLLGEEKEGESRKPRLDGSKLPEYQRVQKFFGPAGSFVTSEANGWYLVGFMLDGQKPIANKADGRQT
ncbi:MAG TPA: hypothetical protein VFW87_10715, partial [Pirellulales bacterium]|nr:hypothetical protein [Pirellulales bacterium]